MISSNGTTIINSDSGNITINSGTITGYSSAISNKGTGKIIINEGTINKTDEHDPSTITNISSGTIEINGGTITSPYRSNTINNSSSGKIIINEGTITPYGWFSGIINSSVGEVEINGGKITNISNNGLLTVNDGIVYGYGSSYGINNGGIANIIGGSIIRGNDNNYSHGTLYNSGTLNVSAGIIKGNDSIITNSGGTVNIENVTLSGSNIGISNTGSGIVNLAVSVTINANNIGISNSATINIGTKDGNVSTEMPVVTGKTYGISNGGSGKVNFYDGVVSGESGAFYGTVNEVEPGYKIVTNKTDTLTSATLSLVGDDEKVAVLNGINFTSLQDAINSASDTNESIITLYKDVTFESNITVPANKNIKLYLNGYILNKGSYDFTGEGKITVIDGTSTNALASIMESVKEVLNIEGIKKNIIIYEMDDGSAI